MHVPIHASSMVAVGHDKLLKLADKVPGMMLKYASTGTALVTEQKKMEAAKSASAIALLYERELRSSVEQWQTALVANGHDWHTIADLIWETIPGQDNIDMRTNDATQRSPIVVCCRQQQALACVRGHYQNRGSHSGVGTTQQPWNSSWNKESDTS
eukprot:COSAG05_NODE_136_length_16902_cov_21.052312_9_plen_156_part_00